jgi:hypothetical protein
LTGVKTGPAFPRLDASCLNAMAKGILEYIEVFYYRQQRHATLK